MKQVSDNHSTAPAAESSLTLSIKVLDYHTCHAESIKASSEITRFQPLLHTPPPKQGLLCEESYLLPFLCSHMYFHSNSIVFSHLSRQAYELMFLLLVHSRLCLPLHTFFTQTSINSTCILLLLR